MYDLRSERINPYLTSERFHPDHLDESISNFRGVWCTKMGR